MLLTSVENEMKTKITSKKDIELERLKTTVKLNQEELQNLTEKLSLLTEGMRCCCKLIVLYSCTQNLQSRFCVDCTTLSNTSTYFDLCGLLCPRV